MDIKKSVSDKVVTLAVSGRLDTSTAPDFEKAMEEVIASSPAELVLDFAELEYTSSAGLRAILKGQKEMTKAGGAMKIVHVCEAVSEVFDITGFTDILNIA